MQRGVSVSHILKNRGSVADSEGNPCEVLVMDNVRQQDPLDGFETAKLLRLSGFRGIIVLLTTGTSCV